MRVGCSIHDFARFERCPTCERAERQELELNADRRWGLKLLQLPPRGYVWVWLPDVLGPSGRVTREGDIYDVHVDERFILAKVVP